MPRRPGDRLRSALVSNVGLACALVSLFAGCQREISDAGCQLTRQLVLPDSPLALLPNARMDRIGARSLLIGSDGAAVRWLVIESNGSVGPEQSLVLPDGVTRAYFAAAGAEGPADRVLVGFVTESGAGTQIQFIAAPIDGSPAPPPGPPVVTFAGAEPAIAVRSSRSGMTAGLAWVDGEVGAVRLATINGLGELAGGPNQIEGTSWPRFECLAFEVGEEALAVSYLRYTSDPGQAPTWAMAESGDDGNIARSLNMTLVMPGGDMGCARGLAFSLANPGAVCVSADAVVDCPDHALVWQDAAGSWLSIFDEANHQVRSFPFSAATDFGGAGLQPPLVGLQRFGAEFGVLLARPRSVELWRIDAMGHRRPGQLIFPSLESNLGSVSAVPADGVLAATYADYGSPGRRIVADAVCH